MLGFNLLKVKTGKHLMLRLEILLGIFQKSSFTNPVRAEENQAFHRERVYFSSIGHFPVESKVVEENLMSLEPLPRWGVRFTSDPSRRKLYLQDLYNEDPENAKRGELFLNEVHAELYFVGSDGVAKKVGEQEVIPFTRVDFTGLREFENDTEASEASPPVPVGGAYRTDNVIKVRLS
jgi:hypothetical protein